MSTRIVKIISIVFMVAAAVMQIVVWSYGDEAIEESAEIASKAVDPYAVIAFIALGLTALSALGFAAMHVIRDPKGARNTIIGIAGLGLVVLIGYLMSSGSDHNLYSKDTMEVSESLSKTVGMALNSFYIVFILTVLVIVYSEVARLFK